MLSTFNATCWIPERPPFFARYFAIGPSSVVDSKSSISQSPHGTKLTFTFCSSTISSSLSDSFLKYSNVLGFGSSYGGMPSNITVNLMGVTYTILDFSVLDDYIDIIRSIFLTLAYLYGFMNL